MNNSLWGFVDLDDVVILTSRNDGNGIGMAIPKWPKKSNVVNPIMTGWWFGTCFFLNILGVIIPSDFHIFQRG